MNSIVPILTKWALRSMPVDFYLSLPFWVLDELGNYLESLETKADPFDAIVSVIEAKETDS